MRLSPHRSALVSILGLTIGGACASAAATTPAGSQAGVACVLRRAPSDVATAMLSAAPVQKRIFVLPLPVPRALRPMTVTARLVVDTSGTPFPDSTQVCGVPDPAYRSRVVQALNALSFAPAKLDGSPLSWDVYITATAP